MTKNSLVTRIKNNTIFDTVEELKLPESKDQNITKDETIRLSSLKAKESGIREKKLRLVPLAVGLLPFRPWPLLWATERSRSGPLANGQ